MKPNAPSIPPATSPGQPPNQPGQDPVNGHPSGGKPSWLWPAVIVGVVVLGGVGAWAYWSSRPAAKPVANTPTRTVKVGLMAPLGSTNATAGLGMKQGAELAIKDLSSTKVNIDLEIKSSDCDTAKGQQAMHDFVNEGKVVAVIGEACSTVTLAAAPIANAGKLPLISPASTSPTISDAGDYVFRTIPSDALAGDYTAGYIYNQRKLKTLAILYSNDPYGAGLKDSVSASYAKLGGRVVAAETYEKDATDVSAQMQRIAASKPDAFYIAAITPVAAMNQYQKLGMTAKTFGSEALKDTNILNDLGSLANGMTLFAVNEGTSDFVEKFRAAYNTDPAAYSAQTYDAVMAVAKAVGTGATTGEAVKNALYKVDFTGVSGTIKFDSKGDVAGNYVPYVVTDGHAKAQASQ